MHTIRSWQPNEHFTGINCVPLLLDCWSDTTVKFLPDLFQICFSELIFNRIAYFLFFQLCLCNYRSYFSKILQTIFINLYKFRLVVVRFLMSLHVLSPCSPSFFMCVRYRRVCYFTFYGAATGDNDVGAKPLLRLKAQNKEKKILRER